MVLLSLLKFLVLCFPLLEKALKMFETNCSQPVTSASYGLWVNMIQHGTAGIVPHTIIPAETELSHVWTAYRINECFDHLSIKAFRYNWFSSLKHRHTVTGKGRENILFFILTSCTHFHIHSLNRGDLGPSSQINGSHQNQSACRRTNTYTNTHRFKGYPNQKREEKSLIYTDSHGIFRNQNSSFQRWFDWVHCLI